MFGRARACRPEHAERVRFIDENLGVVLARNLREAGKVGDRSFHGENAVGHDELGRMLGCGGELSIERGEVTVRIAMHFSEAEAGRVDERGVVEAIKKEMVAATGESGDGSEARLISRRENERCFFLEQLREPVLQLVVQIERAVQEAAARRATAVAVHRLRRRVEYAWMMREAEVVVRADHDLQ